ncbi:MAG TPA: HDOD domain-containing protein [Bryobacteraceae bacterium]|nr:HDOD domain-containing protein [Bryobacteraceae bacterium]
MIAAKKNVDLGRASKVNTLKPFPPAAAKLIELISRETADYRDVSRLLAADAAFTSQVLRVANSALLGARREIKSVVQALSLMGVDRLRSLVVTVAVNYYADHGNKEPLRRAWRHNLATGLWCQALAERCNVSKPMGYTAGMLHDIGRIALLMVFPDDYAALIKNVAGGMDKLEAERKLCDADHCQIGQHLADSWNFPEALVDVIAHHHDSITRETPRLRQLVQASCAAARASGFAAVETDPKWEPEKILDLLPDRNDGLHERCDELLEKIAWKVNEIECSLL